jgi:hypothetical protein
MIRGGYEAAHLTMDIRLAPPFLSGDWALSLVKGVPWTLQLASSLGDFELNLRDLTVEGLNLRSWSGDVALTLPALGRGQMRLHLTLGNLTLRVPDGMGVKLVLSLGALADAPLDSHRFIQTAPGEWVTPNFSAFANQFTLFITLTTGDLRAL